MSYTGTATPSLSQNSNNARLILPTLASCLVACEPNERGTTRGTYDLEWAHLAQDTSPRATGDRPPKPARQARRKVGFRPLLEFPRSSKTGAVRSARFCPKEL